MQLETPPRRQRIYSCVSKPRRLPSACERIFRAGVFKTPGNTEDRARLSSEPHATAREQGVKVCFKTPKENAHSRRSPFYGHQSLTCKRWLPQTIHPFFSDAKQARAARGSGGEARHGSNKTTDLDSVHGTSSYITQRKYPPWVCTVC